MRETCIELDELTKVYRDGTVAVDRLSLEVEREEFLVLLGPSGCGKSTTLRMIAGLEDASSGDLTIDGEPARALAPRDRNIAMVFQNLALYPHMDVRENLGFGLRASGKASSAVDRRVRQISDLLKLDSYLGVQPQRLSGGEQQRVAMGRAMVRRPSVFLMDEPLSNLDAKLRVSLRAEMLSLIRSVRGTTVYVTHDQAEAMTMGDRIAVLRDGTLQQIGSPDEVYHRPANVFVAAFMGSPRMNMVEAVPRISPNGDLELDLGSQQLSVPRSWIRYPDWLVDDMVGHSLIVGLRPEALTVGDAASDRGIRGHVRHIESLGHEALVHADAGTVVPEIEDLESAISPGRPHGPRESPTPGPLRRLAGRLWPRRSHSPAEVQPPPLVLRSTASTGEIVARLPAHHGLRIGDPVEFSIALQMMHLFDFNGRRLPPLLLSNEASRA